jgi:hypothetical protein
MEADPRTNGQIVADFVCRAGRPVSVKEIGEHLKEAGRNPVNAPLDAKNYSVNSNSRVHYGGGMQLRRTDVGNRYDRLYQQADGLFVPYDPAIHGVWEIYADSNGTRRVRLADEATSEGSEPGLPSPADPALPDGTGIFRLESHLRDYLAQNLHLFTFLGTKLKLYGDAGEGVEFPTSVGPIDILAVGENGTLYVFELKVSRGADAAVGQVLRYMGAIRKEVAGSRPVLGVIVASTLTDKLKMAVSELSEKVMAVEYELQVSLKRHT